ncbi:MAG: PilZ domain-containing protein [Planctomycetota bacterium]
MRFNLFRIFRPQPTADLETSDGPVHDNDDGPSEIAHEVAILASINGGAPESVELFDMNIRGARILVPFQFAPTELSDTPVALDIEHRSGSWSVRAHAQLTQLNHWSDDQVMLELEFIRLGELYAQLDNALGRYFNRRGSDRVVPADDDRVGVRLAYGPHRVRGLASDLSSMGICTRAPLVQAAVLHIGERIKAYISLPGTTEEIEVPGVVKHGYREGEDVHLGVEFDLSAPCPMTERRTEYLKYIERRRKAGALLARQRPA